MAIANFEYVDLDGSAKTGQCWVYENRDGFFVAGVVGPQGVSKTKSPVMHWKPIRAAITELLAGRKLVSYRV